MLAVGLVCGSILAALYMGSRENEPGRFGSGIRSLLEKENSPPAGAEPPPAEKKIKPAPKVKLDYHEVLPNMGDDFSDSDLVTDNEPVEERPDRRYILQAGSYRSDRDAEEMKAKLALAGFEAVIQRVNIRYKGTYYRVRMGPYDSKRKVLLDRKRLGKLGINALAIRMDEQTNEQRGTDR